ncbi:MAG: DNA polymerase I [Candidatus Izimaplasma sp.]|nr:DNA polymerase I [Candidatus Izimaplasma bacterium]
MKKLLLIDGSNIMFRAYYATAYSGQLMKNSKGQYTNAIFGFVNMMNSIISEPFTHILVAFDKSGKTFRHDTYADYKGGRKPMPEEFKSQVELIKSSCDVLGIKKYELELIEADDIIGTLAKSYEDDFDEIEIISNDKDLLQLVNGKVTMRSSKRGMQDYISYTKELVEESLGISPNQVTDMKGLMGDSSDNLPGIPGVGEKTAAKLLKEYDTLENVFAHKDDIKGKLGERVREHEEIAKTCKQIATIKTDVELPFTLDDIEFKGEDETALMDFYQELELHSLIKRYKKKHNVPQKQEVNYTIIDDVYALDDILIDRTFLTLETFHSYYHKADKLGFGIVNDNGQFFVPYDLVNQSLQFQMFLNDPRLDKYVYDLKKIRVCLLQDDLDIKGVRFDLLLAAYVLNPSNTKDDFKVIVSHFDYDDIAYYEEVYGKGAKYHIPEQTIYARYAVKKAVAMQTLMPKLNKQLRDNDQYELFSDIELPLASVLAKMEFDGILIDQDKLQDLNDNLQSRIDDITQEIHNIAGEKFNVNSPQQLGEILFDKFDLPFKKKTKTGYSTSINILEKLIDHHPIVPKIMTYRTLSKLHSTYIIGLQNAILEDGKIHTIYKQAFTSTGRLSSVEPNLQNIPIRYEEGREIRKIFIPETNHQLLAADYSQVELRVLAHMADEPTMIDAFRQDEDIHQATARLLFDKDDISSLERRQAKAVNFGIIYGQSAWGLSDSTDLSQSDAKTFIKRYYERFPNIKAFMDKVITHAEDEGYVETMYHRRRYLPELHSSVYMQREAGKRNAMNAPIQGTAADIIKIAMIQLSKKMQAKKMQSKMLLQIHDELVFDLHPDEIEEMQHLVKETMEHCIDLNVPLKVDQNTGPNYFETK